MIANKINPILKCIFCIVLCVCICFSMCFLRPVEVKASVSVGVALSIFASLLGIFGWTMEIGEDLSAIDFSVIADSIGDGFYCLFSALSGNYAVYYYEKHGELTQDMIDEGWRVDDYGRVYNIDSPFENLHDLLLQPVDWEHFEKTGEIKYIMSTEDYESIWQDVQNWIHGGYYTNLGALVKEVSADPTLTELRSSAQNLYLGPIPYTASTHSYDSSTYVYDKTKATAYEFDGFDFDFLNSDGLFGKFYLTTSNGSWIQGMHIQFWEDSYSAWNYCSISNNSVLTAEDFESKWGISVPYSVTDSDGNTNTYCYLFNYNKDVVFRSSSFAWHKLEYGSYIPYNSTEAFKCIDKFDEVLKSKSSSSSSTDDTVRNSATANKYAGTVDDDDDNPIPVTAPGQAGTTTVTGVSSVTNPVTGVKGEDYANGTSVPMTGTVTGTSTVTQTDTGVKTDVGTVVSTATVDYPDGFESWEPSIKLLTKFPFCIPYDFYSCFAILYKDPKELYFEIPFKIEQYGLDEKVVIDLRQFDPIVLIVRYMILILFIMFLTLKTRDLIKG